MHQPSAAARRNSYLVGGLAAVAASALMVGTLAPTGGNASSHREAPLTASDPQVDNTDVYAFRSPNDPSSVTLISNFIPFEEPAGGPNFYAFGQGVRYDIKVDNDHDAKADIIYRWKFKDHYRNEDTFLYNTGPVTSLKDKDLNFFQTYSLKRINVGGRTKVLVENKKVAPSRVGEASMPDYAALRNQAIKRFDGSRKVFAGQTEDPFFLDLRVFDLLYGGDLSEVGDDTLEGFNVNTLALKVPKKDLAMHRRPQKHNIIGVWSTASRRTQRIQRSNGEIDAKGRFVQVSRLGSPLVNEVAIPVGLKDKWNGSKPSGDGQFLEYVNKPILPKVVEAVYGIEQPDSDPDKAGIQRDDLISVFLTGVKGLNQPRNVTPSEQLRLNMSTPVCNPPTCPEYSRLGVIGGDSAGFPNGRRLRDDVVDIALQVFEGELLDNPNDLSDGVDTNDAPRGKGFPYVGLPFSGSNASPHS